MPSSNDWLGLGGERGSVALGDEAYDAEWPPLALGAPPVPLRMLPFLVVDFETTGGSPGAGHRVTEVAAVVVERGQITDVFTSLVNPERPIPWFITDLTGITDAMVRSAPRFPVICDDVLTRLAGRVFVAHNAPFDWRFLTSEATRAARACDAERRLCTVRLARRLLPELPRRTLDALAAHYGVRIEGRHRAAGDAVATAHVLLRLLAHAEREGCESWESLQALLARRRPRKAPSLSAPLAP